MKPKKKINIGFLITIVLLAGIFIVYILLDSRVALAKSDLKEQAESYQTIVTKALVAKPAEISRLNSALASGQDIELLAEEFAENHWSEIQAEIEDYYYDQDTLDLHRKLFCDMLKKFFINGIYLNNITNMNISEHTVRWNLMNQIKISTLWEIESNWEIRTNNQIFSDHFFYHSNEIVWEQINKQWKIIKADLIYPPDLMYYDPEFEMYNSR
ncbi:MAG: hypothetical protein ACOX3H_09785 [Saccharofermentanales bacterium]|jgi:hypothetical protein